MKVPELLETLKAQINPNLQPKIMLQAQAKSYSYNPPQLITLNNDLVVEHIMLTGVYGGGDPQIKIRLTHKNCNKSFQAREVKTVPYHCPYCGKEVIREQDAIDLGLTVDNTKRHAVPRIYLHIAHPEYYYTKDIVGRGNFVNNLYHYHGGWYHVCKSLKGMKSWQAPKKRTAKKFPIKCRFCKETLGAEGFSLNVAFKLGRM